MTYIEIFGMLSALLYLYFSIKQNIFLWPLGIITSALYIYVFFVSKFYADMGLQVYYLVISIYGWYYWIYGKKKETGKLPVTVLNFKLWVLSLIAIAVLFLFIVFILKKFTDSELPYWDSFTTSASIVATWMLAKKKIDNWLLWIVVDSVSAGLYWHKELYVTFVLFIVYTTMAVVGYIQWRKTMSVQDE